MSELQNRGGWAAIAGGLLAIAGDAFVLASSPSVANDRVSYPLTTHAFQVGQVFFALTQALVAVGIVALVRSEAAASAASTVYGIAVLLTDIGLIGFGVLVAAVGSALVREQVAAEPLPATQSS